MREVFRATMAGQASPTRKSGHNSRRTKSGKLFLQREGNGEAAFLILQHSPSRPGATW
jgi:hypothetical protein